MRHGKTPVRKLLGLLAILAVVSVARGQESHYYLPDDSLGRRTAPLLLLTRPDVQADLKLSPAQIKAAEKAVNALYTRAEALRGQPNSREVIRLRAKLDAEQTQWLNTSLELPQAARLVQLDLQWEGPAALVRPIIAESLRITPAQRQALTHLIVQNRMAPLSPPLGMRALGILTVEQQDAWKMMLGEPLQIQRTASKSAGTARR
jgi:hypothetical protein